MSKKRTYICSNCGIECDRLEFELDINDNILCRKCFAPSYVTYSMEHGERVVWDDPHNPNGIIYKDD